MRELLCELLRLFYDKGWVSGTGGGICGLESAGRLLVAPTGVHKERVEPDHLFVVDPATAETIDRPDDPALRPSECSGVFCALVRSRQAGAVVHSHALSAAIAADGSADEIAIAGFEMLKGIRGVSNADLHVLPVVGNTARESELVGDVLRVVFEPSFAAAYAIVVRDHGAYVWGADVWEAKRHAEVYHWLFDAVRARGRP